MSDVKYKLRQNFSMVLPLQLKERGDYHDALGVLPEFMPPARKGRGFWGKAALEYQTALAVDGVNEQARAEAMRDAFVRAGYEDYEGFHAAPIRFIPKDQTYMEFAAEQGGDVLPIGYNRQDISAVTLPLRTAYCYAISAANRNSIGTMTQNLYGMATSLRGKLHLVTLRSETELVQDFDSVYRDDADLMDLLILLKAEFTQRSALKKELTAEKADVFPVIRERFGLLFVFIDSMHDFLERVYDKHDEDYYPLVELFWKQGKGLGVYFIAGFEPNVYGSNQYREAYKLFVSHGTGIHLGGQLDKQKLIDIPFLSRDDYKPKESSEGIMMLDDRTVSVYVPPNRF
jgi:S-DNA-T family DNA segregation ATPase FtsK/SpoIIIE